jgi:hypothetical protein
MKRLITLAIMVAFILGTIGMAQARHAPADFLVGAKGDWQMSGNYVKNPTFDSDAKADKFQAWQRLRTAFEFVASENVKAVFRLHVENKWGAEGHTKGVSKKATGSTIGYDLAYLDLFIPNTDVNLKVGKQLITLPGTLGSHIHDDFAYSVVASTPLTDMLGLTLGWSRLTDLRNRPYADQPDEYSKDEIDMFFAVVPVTLDGIALTPFAAYGRSGKHAIADQDLADDLGVTVAELRSAGKNANWYWVGINAAVNMFDPIIIKGDFNYGGNSELFKDAGDKYGRSAGWIAALSAEYKMDMFTPVLYGLYESGESRSSASLDEKSKIMPTLGGDLFGISSFGFNGSNFRGEGRARISQIQDGAAFGPSGKWGIGLKLRNITFIDKLTHELQAGYYQGTNHKDLRDFGYLTTKDKVWEVNFNHNYRMYENLAAILELGYMKADLSEDTVDRDTDAAWKAAAGFRFRF